MDEVGRDGDDSGRLDVPMELAVRGETLRAAFTFVGMHETEFLVHWIDLREVSSVRLLSSLFKLLLPQKLLVFSLRHLRVFSSLVKKLLALYLNRISTFSGFIKAIGAAHSSSDVGIG